MPFRTLVSGALTAAGETLTSGTFTSLAGDIAVVFVQTNSALPVTSLTDSKGNTPIGGTYSFRYTLTSESFYLYVYIFPLLTFGAGHSFAVGSSGGNQYLTLLVPIISGGNQSTPLDGTPGGFNDSSYLQTHAGASTTSLLAGSTILSYCVDAGANATDTFTAGGAFTIGGSLLGSGGSYQPQMLQYLNNVAAGTYTGNWSTSNFVEGGAITLAIAVAASAGVKFRKTLSLLGGRVGSRQTQG